MKTSMGRRATGMMDTILDAVGSTPLVKLPRAFDPTVRCEVLIKVESVNPGGSIKDRIAIHMVDEAERKGLLKPGGRIVECSSGNTGFGLCMVAAVRGYSITIVIPDKMSAEKIAALRALGATVVVTPANAPIHSPLHYTQTAERIAQECGGWWPNQYHNTDNIQAHYLSTGPEIWEQCGGRLDAFVAAAGTGGSLSGVGRYLKEQNPAVRIVGVDPPGSVLEHWWRTGEMSVPKPYAVEGVGEEEIAAAWDPSVIDDYFVVADRDSFLTARRLARETGIFGGGSTGMNLFAALQVARTLPESARVVTLLPDSGRAYLSKVYSDDWMRDQRYLPQVSAASATVGDLAHDRATACVLPSDTLAWALRQSAERGVRPLPVRDADGKLIGVLDEDAALRRLAEGAALEALKVANHLAPPPPVLRADAPWREAIVALEGREAVLVQRADGSLAPLDRHDLMQSLRRLKHDTR
ncbi:MAG: pyridoxal-phosphate dependent enzyme [Planctomycetota bacterium]|nr:pyridoxal-phosphate dependent enzyme [Planctomycetota bacterium]